MADHFNKLNVETTTTFKELAESIDYEEITEGRLGAVLVDYKDQLVPLVRTTTTSYKKPAQKFLPVHYELIQKTLNGQFQFNNALIEIYDSRYFSMGYHSDQALDLDDNSYICLFSCYEHPVVTGDLRKLRTREKNCSEEVDIVLEHNSVVLFSVDTNRKFLHKIILDPKISSNRWLGITFRLSKTFIKFVDEIPYFFGTDKQLKYHEKSKEFYKYRSEENKKTDFKYPEIDYTISTSDILPIRE